MAVFMSLIDSIFAWWKELTIAGVITAVASYLWTHREPIWEYIVFFRTLKKRFEKVEAKVTNPISPDARLCPVCDKRMGVAHVRFDAWWYECIACGKAFPYPAPTAKNK